MRQDDIVAQAGETIELGFRGMTVGTLLRRTENVTDIEFRYAPEWLRWKDAFPISVTMPLRAEPYGAEVAYPWFLNLLPEGDALNAISAHLRRDKHDVLSVLRDLGADLPGAFSVAVEPTGEERKPRYELLSEAQLAELLRSLPTNPLLIGEEGVRMSLAGVQEKLGVVVGRDGRIGLAKDGAASTHILKPANKNLHASVVNEAFCLKLAAAIGLSAAKVSIGRAEDIEYLLVERYDRRKVKDVGIVRLHQEDMCQATGTQPWFKYESNPGTGVSGPSIKACMDAMELTSAPGRNKVRFFEAMVFNVLAGNVDAHAKNYSLVLEGRSQHLAPLYDVMNGDIYPHVTKNLAMRIAGKQRGDHIHGRHWDRLAEENGLSARLLRSRVEHLSNAVIKAIPGVVAEMDALANGGVMHRQVAEHIERHCRNMLANLRTEPAPVEDMAEDFDGLGEVDDDGDEPMVISP